MQILEDDQDISTYLTYLTYLTLRLEKIVDIYAKMLMILIMLHINQTVKLEEMEKKAGNAEGEVSALRSRLILLQVDHDDVFDDDCYKTCFAGEQ